MIEAERGPRPPAAGIGTLMNGILSLPLYPALVAAYFPLHLMSANLGLFRAEHLFRPMAFLTIVAVLAVALLAALMRNPHRAALWTALALIFTLFFMPLQSALNTVTRASLDTSYSGDVRFVVLLLLCVVIGALVRPGRSFTQVANVIAAVMLLIPAVTTLRAAFAASQAQGVIEAEAEMQRQALFGAVPGGTAKPSIVHIVLDGYARQDVLQEVYGFDNRAFLDRLRELGFAVADQATTPYSQTLLVLNSVFGAQYVQEMLPSRSSDPDRFRQTLGARLQINHVMRTLSGLGYQTAAADVDYDPIRVDRVDRFFSTRGFALTNFEKAAYIRTAIVHLQRMIDSSGTGDSIKSTVARPHHRDLEAPFFLFLHLIAPHPPFDVDRHGTPVDVSDQEGIADGSPLMQGNPALQRVYRDGYVEKLQFANTQVLGYLERLLAEVPDPKIVIVHGDHGGGMLLDHEDQTASCLKERFSPLLAVYSSDGRLQAAMPDDLNLANLYRMVFNTAFGTALPLLPDRHFFAAWSRPDRFEPLSSAQIQESCGPGVS